MSRLHRHSSPLISPQVMSTRSDHTSDHNDHGTVSPYAASSVYSQGAGGEVDSMQDQHRNQNHDWNNRPSWGAKMARALPFSQLRNKQTDDLPTRVANSTDVESAKVTNSRRDTRARAYSNPLHILHVDSWWRGKRSKGTLAGNGELEPLLAGFQDQESDETNLCFQQKLGTGLSYKERNKFDQEHRVEEVNLSQSDASTSALIQELVPRPLFASVGQQAGPPAGSDGVEHIQLKPRAPFRLIDPTKRYTLSDLTEILHPEPVKTEQKRTLRHRLSRLALVMSGPKDKEMSPVQHSTTADLRKRDVTCPHWALPLDYTTREDDYSSALRTTLRIKASEAQEKQEHEEYEFYRALVDEMRWSPEVIYNTAYQGKGKAKRVERRPRAMSAPLQFVNTQVAKSSFPDGGMTSKIDDRADSGLGKGAEPIRDPNEQQDGAWLTRRDGRTIRLRWHEDKRQWLD